MSWTCDKENDCENGADEAHCGEDARSSTKKLCLIHFRGMSCQFVAHSVQLQISSAQLLSLSAPTTAASPKAGSVTEPTTVATVVMRTASAVSVLGYQLPEEEQKQMAI